VSQVQPPAPQLPNQPVPEATGHQALFQDPNKELGGYTVHEGAEEWEEEEEYEESQQMFNSGFRSVLKGKQGQSINEAAQVLRGGGGPGGAPEFRTQSNLGMEDRKSLEEAA